MASKTGFWPVRAGVGQQAGPHLQEDLQGEHGEDVERPERLLADAEDRGGAAGGLRARARDHRSASGSGSGSALGVHVRVGAGPWPPAGSIPASTFSWRFE